MASSPGMTPLSYALILPYCTPQSTYLLSHRSKDYDEERQMEPRPEPNQEATLTLQPRFLWSVGNEKELWDLRKHQTRKEAGEEGTPKFSTSSKEKAKAPGPSLPDTLTILYRFWVYTKSIKGRDRFSPCRGPNHGLLSNLSKSPREILATEKAARSFEYPPRMFGSRRSRDMSKYCYFHEDYRDDTNDCRQLRNQIKEAVKSGQLSHLVKGIKKEKVKASKNELTEGKKDKSPTPAEAPLPMIRQVESYTKNKFEGLTSKSKEITFPSGGSNSSAASKVDLKVPLIRFSGEKSWSIGKIPLEITIGDPPLTRKETLSFVIFKPDSPYNMLLGRTTMQKMATVVSTIHGAIKFHTTRGIGERVCYRKTPFGLKNARATYQRLLDKVFHDQIGRNLEAYVDDMVIKSTFEEDMLANIKETFEKFRSINMKINPKKCSFDIEEGPFLGHLITKVPKDHFSSSRYSKAAQIRRTYNGQEAEAVLQEMKKFVEIPPTLTEPVQGEILMMYLTASTESISAALFTKREEEQIPIYFVSRVPQGLSSTTQEWKSSYYHWYMQQGGYEGTYADKQPTIREYLQKTKEALKGFDSYTIEHIRRNQNKKAVALSKLALMTFEHLTKKVMVEVLLKRSIEEKETLQVKTKEGESSMTPIYEYLVSGLLPEDPKESRKIRTNDIVKEVHEGSCGFNIEPRSMVVRIMKQGYYWPSMHRDDAKVLQDYKKCKEQSAIRKVAESSVITAGSGWPFSHWGVNILGPLPTAPGDLCKGLKVTQSFFPITEHMEIMNHIEKQLARSQQGWVDDLAQVLWGKDKGSRQEKKKQGNSFNQRGLLSK
uniref:Reverse transcriptase domain-containing protein n=1 Tax=Tanacetum cinerariifolium TaxID=118510 RepID=A0A6L2N9S7_TANCI|nr:hypothetical protein [Tanacetum cinerariifolium]